jgi:membrane-associated phospholipid phosphatase/CTP:molybdopterin cytidylyltransferase MocA
MHEYSAQTRFDVMITAGYNPHKPDPLMAITGSAHKALVEVAGKPMIWHVVQALNESGLVREIVIIGLDEEHQIDFGRPVHYVPNQETLWANQHAGLEKLLEIDPSNRVVLATPADIPLLTGDIVRWFVESCRPFDKELYWAVVPKDVMEAAFPGSGRTFVPLKDGSFCSGALFLGDLHAAMGYQEKLRDLMATRKNFLQQAWLLGPWVLVQLLFRRLTVEALLGVAQDFLGVTGGAVISPFAEIGMDIDKPHQLTQVREFLAAHPEHPASLRTQGMPAPATYPLPTAHPGAEPLPAVGPPPIHETTAREELGSILSKVDEVVSSRIALKDAQRTPRSPLFWLANIGAHLGDSILWTAITAWLWRQASQGDPQEKEERKRVLTGWIGAQIAAFAVVMIVKRLFRRTRPGTGAMLYGIGPDVHSFPSGHGARSGVIKVWANSLVPGSGPWSWLLVLWIGWSRAALGIHYVGDLVAGFGLGVVIGKLSQLIVGKPESTTDEGGTSYE